MVLIEAAVCVSSLYESERNKKKIYLSETIVVLQIDCWSKLFSDVSRCNFNIKAVLNYSIGGVA